MGARSATSYLQLRLECPRNDGAPLNAPFIYMSLLHSVLDDGLSIHHSRRLVRGTVENTAPPQSASRATRQPSHERIFLCNARQPSYCLFGNRTSVIAARERVDCFSLEHFWCVMTRRSKRISITGGVDYLAQAPRAACRTCPSIFPKPFGILSLPMEMAA